MQSFRRRFQSWQRMGVVLDNCFVSGLVDSVVVVVVVVVAAAAAA